MFVIIIWEAKTLYFLVFHHVIIVANYDLAIIEGYLAGNAKIKISIKFDFHIQWPLTTVANWKGGPENKQMATSRVKPGFIGHFSRSLH